MMLLTAPRTVHDRRWWTLAVLCTSLVLITIDTTILNVAIPTLSRSLATTTGELQWIVDAYTVVFAGLLLTCGSLGDRFRSAKDARSRVGRVRPRLRGIGDRRLPPR